MKFLNRYFFAGVGTGCLLSILLSVGIAFGFGYFAMRQFGDVAGGPEGTSSLRPPDFPSSDRALTAHGEADWSWRLSPIQGEPVTLGDFQGQVIFLNLWATWCGPCKRELPHLQRLYDSLKAEGIQFLNVSKEDPEKVREFLATQPYDMPFYMSDGNPPPDLRSNAIPAAFIIDLDGTVVFKERGAQAWDDESALAFLRDLAGGEG